jgi:hypothetical protein
MKKMFRGVAVSLILGAMMIGSGGVFAQEGDGDDDPTPIVIPAETPSTGGDGGATFTVWRGSEPYDGDTPSDITSEESEDAAGPVVGPQLKFKF